MTDVYQAHNVSSPVPTVGRAIIAGHVCTATVRRVIRHVWCVVGQSGAHPERKAAN